MIYFFYKIEMEINQQPKATIKMTPIISNLIAKGQSDDGEQHFYEIDGISIVLDNLSIDQKAYVQSNIDDYLAKIKWLVNLYYATEEESEDEEEEKWEVENGISDRLRVHGMEFNIDHMTERGYIQFAFTLID